MARLRLDATPDVDTLTTETAHMHTRNISVGRQTIVDRNRPARQAGGRRGHRPLGRHDGARHGLRRGQPARGHRLPAADGRLPRVHLRVGADPRRVLQARGQAEREGSADEPPDRSADPAALPVRLAPRDADHRAACSRPTPRTTATCWRSPAPRRRWRSPAIPFTRTIAGVRVGPGRRRVHHQPDVRAAPQQPRSI